MKYLVLLLGLFVFNCAPAPKPVDELEKVFRSDVEYACFFMLKNADRLELFGDCVKFHMTKNYKEFKALKEAQDKTNVSK